jgi:hypothetical protein
MGRQISGGRASKMFELFPGKLSAETIEQGDYRLYKNSHMWAADKDLFNKAVEVANHVAKHYGFDPKEGSKLK